MLPGLRSAFLLVRTNEGRLAKLLVQRAQQRQSVVADALVLVHDEHLVEERIDAGPELGEHRIGGEVVLGVERLGDLGAAPLQSVRQRRFRGFVGA